MKKITACLLAGAAWVMAVPAAAQVAKVEDAVKYRKSAMFVMLQILVVKLA